MYKQAHNSIYVVWNGGGRLHRRKLLSNPLRNMKQELLSSSWGRRTLLTHVWPFRLPLQAHLRGRGCPSIEAEPTHAPSWRVPGALGKTHS